MTSKEILHKERKFLTQTVNRMKKNVFTFALQETHLLSFTSKDLI